MFERITKYTLEPEHFKPQGYREVRWLSDEDFKFVEEFWNMSFEDWKMAKKLNYKYCAIILENKIVSIAAAWKCSEENWEVAAVNTRSEFSNQGLAKRVVSFVTDHILNNRRKPTVSIREDNYRMKRVAESIGYRLSEIITVEDK